MPPVKDYRPTLFDLQLLLERVNPFEGSSIEGEIARLKQEQRQRDEVQAARQQQAEAPPTEVAPVLSAPASVA